MATVAATHATQLATLGADCAADRRAAQVREERDEPLAETAASHAGILQQAGRHFLQEVVGVEQRARPVREEPFAKTAQPALQETRLASQELVEGNRARVLD